MTQRNIDNNETPSSVRVHISEPGPRSGVQYSLSVECINGRELTDDDITAEVNAALKVYDKAHEEMERRFHRDLTQDLADSLSQTTGPAGGGG